MRRFGSPDKGFAQQRPGLANCGCSEPWEGGRRPTDLGERNPRSDQRERRRIQTCYVQLGRSLFSILPIYFTIKYDITFPIIIIIKDDIVDINVVIILYFIIIF